MRLAVAMGLALLVGAPTLARAEEQVWDALFVQYRPTQGGIAGWLDTQVRRGSSTVMILRPGIGWAIGERLTFHVGYGYIHTYIPSAADGTEHRLWQQVVYNHPVSDELKLQGRFRVEQRFIGGDDGTGHRIRALGRVQYGPRPNSLQLVVINELFVNLTDTMKTKAGYNQNRAFFGFGIDTKMKGVRVEAGYQNIDLDDNDRIDHAVVINVFGMIQ